MSALFRKKPVIIEAEQYLPPYSRICEVPPGVCLHSCMDSPWGHVHTIHANQCVAIVPGDWLIPEPDGVHFYPVKPDIFAATYEPVDGTT